MPAQLRARRSAPCRATATTVTVPPSRTRVARRPGRCSSTRPAGTVSEYAGVADLGVEPGGLEPLDGGRPRAGRARPGSWCSGPSRTTRRRRRARRRAAGRARSSSGPRRRAARRGGRRGGTAARAGAAARRRRPRPADAVGVASRRGSRRSAPRARAVDGVGGRRARRRARRRRTSSARCRARTRTRQQVGGELGVVAHAVAQRLADPVDLVEEHAGVGRPLARGRGRWPGRPARRRTPGCPGTSAEGGGHVLVDVLVGDLDRRLALVRLGAGEQLVEHDAGGVDVGAGVGAAVDDQLGGEVGDGADQHAAGRGVLGVGADRLGQPEVGDLDPPPGRRR